jgi:hypothetical protein
VKNNATNFQTKDNAIHNSDDSSSVKKSINPFTFRYNNDQSFENNKVD